MIAQVLFPRQANQERTVGPYIPTFYQFFDSILHCATSDVSTSVLCVRARGIILSHFPPTLPPALPPSLPPSLLSLPPSHPPTQNELMQQPLAHLYFLTVFEDLLSSSFSLPNLIRTSQKIAKVCPHSRPFKAHFPELSNKPPYS